MRRPSAVLTLAAAAAVLAACQPAAPTLGGWFHPDLPKLKAHADWMGESKAYLNDLPLNQAIIPGSHDAGTFSITGTSTISPDLPLDSVPADPDTLKNLRDALVKAPELQPLNEFMSKWARAQGIDIKSQLTHGIRYFDLRPAVKATANGFELRIAHSLYGAPLEPMIDEVAAFVAAHPKEVVFLDISHFAGLSASHHQHLVNYIKTKLGPELIPAPEGATATDPRANWRTFGSVWQTGAQVVCFYQTDAVSDPQLWRHGIPGGTSWWPDKPTTSGVKTHLSQILSVERPKLSQGSFFVLQTVLTGDTEMYGKAIAKQKVLNLVADAKSKLQSFQETYDSAKGSLDRLRKTIKDDKKEISDLWDAIKDHPFDVVGNARRSSKIASLEAAVLLNEGYLAGKEAAVDAAKGPLDQAKAKVSELEKQVESLHDTPTSLRELAAQGNPTMLNWLSNDWAKEPLNIVILDWAQDTDFVERIITLNKAKGRHDNPAA